MRDPQVKTYVEFDDLQEMYTTLVAVEAPSRDLGALKGVLHISGGVFAGDVPDGFRFFDATPDPLSPHGYRDAHNYSEFHVHRDNVTPAAQFIREKREELVQTGNGLGLATELFNFAASRLGLGQPFASKRAVSADLQNLQILEAKVRAQNAAFIAVPVRGMDGMPLTKDMVVYDDALNSVQLKSAPVTQPPRAPR